MPLAESHSSRDMEDAMTEIAAGRGKSNWPLARAGPSVDYSDTHIRNYDPVPDRDGRPGTITAARRGDRR
jgi:hypothetical protein